MNRVVSAIATPFRVVGQAMVATAGAVEMGVTMLFARGRGWGILLSRTRIDYKAEVGDPATNSIVGAVVGWKARNLPQAPIRIVKEGTTDIAYRPRATGPGYMLRLLERPNPYYSGLLQMQATIVDWICRGNAYWFKVRSESGRVVELYWIPERLLEPRWPQNDPTVFIGWYDYNLDGVTYVVDPRDIVHFRNGIDPNNPRKGLSKLASLFREIFSDEEAANFTASLLRNVGVPGVTIAPANTTGSGRLGTLDPETVKKSWLEKFTGDKRGEPFVSNLPIEVKKIAFSPQEMDLKSLRRVPEERISAVLGVPAGVAQLGAGLDRNTFTNYGEGNVAAYTQGVIPDQELLAADLEYQLLSEFADLDEIAVDVWFDWTRVPAMAAAASALWKQYEGAATKGLITRKVFKLANGLAVDDADDVYVVPNNYLFVAEGGTPPLPPTQASAPARAPAAVASEVRCQGCSKLLAEAATAPYRMTCPRCKAVTAAVAEPADLLPEGSAAAFATVAGEAIAAGSRQSEQMVAGFAELAAAVASRPIEHVTRIEEGAIAAPEVHVTVEAPPPGKMTRTVTRRDAKGRADEVEETREAVTSGT